MKNLLVVFLLFLFVIPAAFAQQAANITAQPNTVYVGADGRFEAAPDTAVIQFNISAQENTAQAAYDRATKAAEQIRSLLRSNGIEPKEAQIGFFSLAPVYDYRNPKRKLVAYRVNSSVTLKLHDFSKVAPIIQQLADLDVTENQSVSYTLDNMESAKIRAIQDAFHRAQGEAEALAKAGGRTLGELSYASADTQEQIRPIARPMMMMRAETAQAAPAPTEEFTPQQITVTAHVNAVFVLH